MAMHVVDLKDAAKYFGGVVTPYIRRGAMKGLYSASLRMVEEIKVRTIPQTVPQPVNRGIYRAGWKAARTEDGATYYNPLPYAAAIEYGVRPQNVKVGVKMILALTDWVISKGLAGKGKRRQRRAIELAWAIALAMKKKGIFGSGLRIMQTANKVLDQVVKEEVTREIERILQGGGQHE